MPQDTTTAVDACLDRIGETLNAQTVQMVQKGASSTGTYPWPQTWTWPTYTYPAYPTYISVPTDDYANEIEVDRHDHDATLRFYRTRGNSRSLVKEITIPVGLLDWLKEA